MLNIVEQILNFIIFIKFIFIIQGLLKNNQYNLTVLGIFDNLLSVIIA